MVGDGAVPAGPGPGRAGGDDVAVAVGRDGGGRGPVGVENGELDEIVEQTDGLIEGDVLLACAAAIQCLSQREHVPEKPGSSRQVLRVEGGRGDEVEHADGPLDVLRRHPGPVGWWHVHVVFETMKRPASHFDAVPTAPRQAIRVAKIFSRHDPSRCGPELFAHPVLVAGSR